MKNGWQETFVVTSFFFGRDSRKNKNEELPFFDDPKDDHFPIDTESYGDLSSVA